MLKKISLLLSFTVIFPSLVYAMHDEDPASTGRGLHKQQKAVEAPPPLSFEEIIPEVEITTHRFAFEYMGVKVPMSDYVFKTQRPKPLTVTDIRRENIRKQYIKLKERQDFSFALEMDRHYESSGLDSEERLAIMIEIIKDYEERQQIIINQIKNEYF